MANFKGKTCFVIGGFNVSSCTILSSVSRYNIDKDQWEPGTPDLKVARKAAAACSLGDSVFVFGD